MSYPIDIKKFLVQFGYNTPVHIAIFSALELILEVSYCFLAQQSMRVTLKI